MYKAFPLITIIIIVISIFLGVGSYIILLVPSVQGLHLYVIYYLIPLLIGTFILAKFGKDESAKCIGILSIKPLFTLLFFGLIGRLELYKELYNLYPYNIVRAVLWLFPELFLTIVVSHSFKALIRRDKAVLRFLIGDIVRWLTVVISLSFPDPIPEPYFYWQLYDGVIFAFFIPPLYAVAGLVFTARRAKAMGMQLETETTSS
jgi:hypothetical protein